MEVPIGRHVQAALNAQRAPRTDIHDESPVHVTMPRQTVDPDTVRRLFEQIGTLYEHAGDADALAVEMTGQQGDEDGTAVQELADFLDTVRRAMRNPGGQTAAALRLALHRYEHARNPRGDA